MELFRDHWSIIGDDKIYAQVSVDESDPVDQLQSVIVLVHGLGVSSAYMMPTAAALAKHYRVYVPDLPGFGRSSKPSHVLNIEELADALAAWMRVNNLPDTIMLGNSLGAQIIINCVVRRPQSVRRVILVGPTMDPDRQSILRLTLSLLSDAFREPFSLIPLAARDFIRAGLRRVYRTLIYALRDHVETKLKLVTVPALVVRGRGDPISTQSWNEKMVELLPEAKLMVINDAAHAVNYSSPEELSRAVIEFDQKHKTAK